jgi:hypothetical protein
MVEGFAIYSFFFSNVSTLGERKPEGLLGPPLFVTQLYIFSVHPGRELNHGHERQEQLATILQSLTGWEK